jgi:hypothetical protein
VSNSATPHGGCPLGTSVRLESIPCAEALRQRPASHPDFDKENRMLVFLANVLTATKNARYRLCILFALSMALFSINGGLDSRLGGLIFEFRATVPAATRTAVLMESGYKCGNPACRNILTLGLHHIVWVRDGGGNAAMRRARFKRWTGRSRASPEQGPSS